MDFDFQKNIVLENTRALLAPLQEKDFENLISIATADASLLQYSPLSVHSKELLQSYIANALTERTNRFRYAFVIYDKQLNQYAGSTSFANISNKDKRLEIGWTWIGKQFQKTGLNRACKLLMMEYAFDTLGFERVEYKTDERNLQSRTAIEKIGGKLEGILRSHTVVSDGYRRNTVYYSILKAEWPEIKHRLVKQISAYASSNP